MYKINIQTKQKESLIEITDKINTLISNYKINNGILHIYTPHTTAAITINENADKDVQKDMIYFFNKLVPNLKEFKHLEGNSDAHIKSSLIGCSETVIIENNKIILGTWQGIYFCEFDGPRNRKIYIKHIG
jgi:secondary thiamine-phosphate synthase enzyme